MAAFRGRSPLRLGREELPGAGVLEELCTTGFVFCASFSVTLTLEAPAEVVPRSLPCCWLNRGGRLSLISGLPPAMDVSGTPAFRGGCGTGSDGRLEG